MDLNVNIGCISNQMCSFQQSAPYGRVVGVLFCRQLFHVMMYCAVRVVRWLGEFPVC